MIDYLKNIIPRIQNASKQLDQIEVFVNKPWVMIEEGSTDHIEFLFYHDKRLLVTKGGIGEWGKWELTPTNDRLILTYSTKTIKLQKAFIDDAIMAIKLSGSDDPTMLFINSDRIPDLNYRNYLNEVEKKIATIGMPDIVNGLPAGDIDTLDLSGLYIVLFIIVALLFIFSMLSG